MLSHFRVTIFRLNWLNCTVKVRRTGNDTENGRDEKTGIEIAKYTMG